MSVRIDTLIFDIDDTLYSASSGFSAHRNGDVITAFMMARLGFESRAEALSLRDEYFKKHHSTLKGLAMADKEGRLPRPFVQEELGQFWAQHCDFERYLKPNSSLRADLMAVKAKLVAFTNAPRAYGLKCLEALGLDDLFELYGVEDVMPFCKPEKEAFEYVLNAVHATNAVMFEDSMKNIRACRDVGIRTVLVLDHGEGSEAALLADTPDASDPAVDFVVPRISEIRRLLPELWEDPPTLNLKPT